MKKVTYKVRINGVLFTRKSFHHYRAALVVRDRNNPDSIRVRSFHHSVDLARSAGSQAENHGIQVIGIIDLGDHTSASVSTVNGFRVELGVE